MAKRKNLEVSEDPLDIFISELRSSAKTPNIHAYTPHEKQLAFHSSEAKARLFIGGNRSGKTHGGVAEDIYWFRGNHPYRKIPDTTIRGRVVGVDFLHGIEKILIPKFKDLLPPSALINGSWEDSWSAQTRTLTGSNGNTIEFMSYDQDLDKFAGTSRHFIHMDEEPPESIFNENRARLVDTNGDIWLTMTPLDGFTWTYNNLYLKGLDPDEPGYFTVEVSMEDNTRLSAEAREAFLSSLDEEERNAREHGQYMSVGGKVYKSFLRERHVIPYNLTDIQNKLASGWSLYASVDHGWNNPTAWEWAIVSPKGTPPKVIVIDEHYASEMLIAEHAREYKRRIPLYGEPDMITGDPAMRQTSAINGMSVITTYANEGIFINVEPVPKGPGSVTIGVEKLNKYLANGKDGKPILQIMDKCENLINQMAMLRWKSYKGKAKDENNKYEEIQKKDDHAPDSLRYLVTLLPDLQREQQEETPVDGATGLKLRKLSLEQRNIDPLLARMVLGDDPNSDSASPYTIVGEDNSEWEFI